MSYTHCGKCISKVVPILSSKKATRRCAFLHKHFAGLSSIVVILTNSKPDGKFFPMVDFSQTQ